MANRFLKQLEPSPESPPTKTGEPSSNRFLSQIEGVKFPEKEGFGKSVTRTINQVALGGLQALTYPLNIAQLAGQGDALAELEDLNEDRIADLKKKFPTAPWENFKGIDREKYLKAVQEAGDIFPTQQNIERGIEEKLGVPLTPKNKLQHLIRLGSSAAAFRPGTAGERATAGVVAPVVKEGLQATGVPEPVAEGLGFVASGVTPSPKISKVTKPSGMTARRFEKVDKPTKVSPNREAAIKESVEGDFKEIADQILKKNRTYSAMKEDNLFKEKVGDLFEQVEDLASNMEGTVHSEQLRNSLKGRFNSRDSKGISPDEFERTLKKEVRGILKEIPYKDLTAPQLVEQFRKNNRSLRELFEPGKSSAANRAKREALLDYNRAIEDLISKKYPNSEFGDLFKFTNKRWQEISDIEQIDGFVKNIFDGKVNYSKAKQLFRTDKEHIQKPFKRVLGEEGFADFKQLTEDLLSTEKSMAYIKKANEAGYGDLAKTASLYLASPKAGTAYTLSKGGKALYQSVLDKPQLNITWKSAFDNLKKGRFKEAEQGFKKLDAEIHPNTTKGPTSIHK